MSRGPRAEIVGAFATEVGKRPGLNSLELHAEAFLGALDDAGLEAGDVDGLVTLGSFSMSYLMHSTAVAEYLGLRHLRYAAVGSVGGASAVSALNHAALLVAAGVCRTAVVLSADDQLSGMTRDLALKAMLSNRHPQYEGPYGPTTAAAYAMAARRYLVDYGVEPELLGWATVQSREYGSRRRSAMMPVPVGLDDIAASKPIAEPLRMLHCAPIADGGGAVVVGAAGRGAAAPVRIAGAGERHANAHLVYNQSLLTSPAVGAAAEAFEEAGCGPGDVDVALVYDAFASSVGSALEDLGLAPRGRVFHAFRDGEFGPGGRLPVNPHGGLLSGGHPGYPGGILHVVEAVRQLRGDAEVQIPRARRALVQGSGGIMTTQSVMVLETTA